MLISEDAICGPILELLEGRAYFIDEVMHETQ
jgi:hypothetical protein